MARAFAAASSEYVEMTTAVVTAYPFTVMGWGYVTTLATSQCLWAVTRSSVNNHLWRLTLDPTTGTLSVVATAGGTSSTVTTTTSVSTNTWFHFAGVFASATSRTVYLNAGGNQTDTTSRTPTSLNRTSLGRFLINSGGFDYLTGRLDYVGVWNVALDAKEILAGAQGADPRSIQPASLVDLRLLGLQSPEGNWVGAGRTMTVTGTTVAPGPPVAVWRRRWFTAAPWLPAAGGITLTADPGSYTVSGSAATLGLSLSEAAGSYALAGTAASISLGLVAAPGSYTVSGTAADLSVSSALTLAANAGAYTLSGTAATISISSGLSLTADPGSYSLAGTAATLRLGLSEAAGAYSLSGSAATIRLGLALAANAGAYSLSGTAASLALRLQAGGGAYLWTGTAATLLPLVGILLNAAPGAYILTGYGVFVPPAPAIIDTDLAVAFFESDRPSRPDYLVGIMDPVEVTKLNTRQMQGRPSRPPFAEVG